MKKLVAALILLNCHLLPANSQTAYWQQQVNYRIDVTLNDKDHSLDGFEKIDYTNNSPDTLHFIWFHLWPNAYKNDKTAFSDQQLVNGNTKFYFSDKKDKGYINRIDFKVDNVTAETEDHPQHIDIVKLILPSPLAPGQTINISTPFHVKLPFNFSRGGHDGQSYQATQWYPKPAVYDSRGWHPMPYLNQGEFYSEFGNFDVQITVPENYAVAATGELQDQSEKEWLVTRNNFSWKATTKKTKSKGGITKKVVQEFPASSAKTKTIHFIQNNVHDFAWFADKRFIVKQDTCQLASGRIINVFAYYTQANEKLWGDAVTYGKNAIRFYSEQVGEYPYNTASIVEGPKNYGGGMEYPAITVIAPSRSKEALDHVIAHELGHNWFYGILASDERDHPWMDEGTNSFYTDKYIAARKHTDIQNQAKVLYETKAVTQTDQPIETTSENFSVANYALVAYFKTSEWLRWLEATVGKETFAKAMQDYYKQWQFKHPQPEDFKKSLEASTGQNLDSVFSFIAKNGLLPNDIKKGTSVGLMFEKKHFNKLIGNNVTAAKNIITVSPAIGFNSYDKLMAGIFITNYKLPPTKFKFFLAPMYATGSQTLTGTGSLNYSFYPEMNLFRRIDLFVNGSTFTTDLYTDSVNRKVYTGYKKLTPGFRFVFREKDPRSTRYRFFQFKAFHFNEDGVQFGRDTITNGIDTIVQNTYKKVSDSRTLRQLRIVYENNRALYPYNGDLKLEQGEDFMRVAFTGNYFFNYAKGGGLNVRLFAGKFFYLGERTSNKEFNNDRYNLNMTGANGYEDYTYSDYFIGRNKFEGMASQQIMVRDGGFKMRTDLLSEKIGKSDEWLVAANFTSSVHPKIPLKVFADIGSYQEAWKKNSGLDHFLFDAGIHLSLLKETINIYVPLVYSKVYKNYIQSVYPKNERLSKKISFSIDIANFSLRKINRNLVF